MDSYLPESDSHESKISVCGRGSAPDPGRADGHVVVPQGVHTDPVTFPPEAEVATPDDAIRILDRAYRTLDSILPTLTPEVLATPRTFQRRGRAAVLPPWVVLRHVVNHTTYHRGQVASKLKRFGIQQPETDLVYFALEQVPQPK